MIEESESSGTRESDTEIIRKIRTRVAEVQELVDEMKDRLIDKE